MLNTNRAIAIIPSEHFRWRARVQFKESFPERAEALNYARRHGYNLIVQGDEANGPQFDVLEDPDLACTSGISIDLIELEDGVPDYSMVEWTSLMLSNVWDFVRGVAAAIICLYLREIAPRIQHAASRCRRWDIEGAVRRAWSSEILSTGRAHARRVATALASLYLREIAPRIRYAASLRWWADIEAAVRGSDGAVVTPQHSKPSQLH